MWLWIFRASRPPVMVSVRGQQPLFPLTARWGHGVAPLHSKPGVLLVDILLQPEGWSLYWATTCQSSPAAYPVVDTIVYREMLHVIVQYHCISGRLPLFWLTPSQQSKAGFLFFNTIPAQKSLESYWPGHSKYTHGFAQLGHWGLNTQIIIVCKKCYLIGFVNSDT